MDEGQTYGADGPARAAEIQQLLAEVHEEMAGRDTAEVTVAIRRRWAEKYDWAPDSAAVEKWSIIISGGSRVRIIPLG